MTQTRTRYGSRLVGNREYGVRNDLEQVVDARFNYWGASNGPSSPPDPDAPFADPVTGRLADGSGDAVSESPKCADAASRTCAFTRGHGARSPPARALATHSTAPDRSAVPDRPAVPPAD